MVDFAPEADGVAQAEVFGQSDELSAERAIADDVESGVRVFLVDETKRAQQRDLVLDGSQGGDVDQCLRGLRFLATGLEQVEVDAQRRQLQAGTGNVA